ncbi:MAG: marine proteobacterial sortase target protein [Kiloniellaceae bacterium]|nr:marine proteobacterial sortase target protein [Kiloniellaceae bacterium]
MPHHLPPQHVYSAFPSRLGRTVLHNVLVIAGTLVLAVLVMLAALAVRALPAQAAEAETPAGLFFRSGEAGTVLEAPILKSDVAIAVNGMVARATVRQVFHNPSDRWLEGIYVFPLPERSAVDRLTMTIGERRVEGRIMEKAEAERAYRAAADNGQRASLVSGERPNVFVTAVANIGPGESITVEIGFQDAVAYENGTFALRFPMVVAPRYTPEPQPDIAEAPAPQPAIDPVAATGTSGEDGDLFGPVHTDGDKHNLLSLTVELDAGLPLASLRSLYHPVTIETGTGNRQTVILRDGEVPADRDFVLEWAPKASDSPQAAVFAEQVGANAHLLVMMVPPALQAGSLATPLPRELVFVVDTSGSMHGDSLDQAKAAVIAALKRLRPEDRFNVIQFNSTTHALFPQPVAATVANAAKAWHYVSALEAEGGTEMRPALQLALGAAPSESHLQQVVFLTDGAVGNEDELLREVAGQLGAQRLFTVGIGSAPNSYFMRKAAEIGRGSFTHIGDLGEVKPRMDALLAKLEQPALTEIRVGWPLTAGKRIELYPTPLPDLYAGEPVTFAARLEGVDLKELDGQLLIIGNAADGPWQQRLALSELTAAPGVAAVWARAKLVQIEDGLYRSGPETDQAAIRAQALALALDHGLVTRYTALVAIDDAVARPQGENLQSEEIARDLPAGWDAGKVFGHPGTAESPAPASTEMRQWALPAPLLQRAAAADGQAITLPQTATPAERMAILGGAYLLLGLLLVLLVLRRQCRTGHSG